MSVGDFKRELIKMEKFANKKCDEMLNEHKMKCRVKNTHVTEEDENGIITTVAMLLEDKIVNLINYECEDKYSCIDYYKNNTPAIISKVHTFLLTKMSFQQ